MPVRFLVLSAAINAMVIFGCFRPNNKFGFTVKTFKTGKGAGSVELADFNNDGHADIVVANIDDSSVMVLLADGKGNFKESKGSPFFANRDPNDIAIADVNKDGNADLCIANTEVSYLTVLIGNGEGQFYQPFQSPYAVHSKPHTHGIGVADFDGDGNMDLATESWSENKVLIIFGDGKLNFGDETFYRVGNRPYQRLRVADVNNDGKPDIVTTNLEGNNATVLLGQGGGKFSEAQGSPFPCGDAPFGVSIGDLNGDGNPDLAIANSPTITAESKGQDGLWILLGDGTGRFSPLQGSPFKTGRSPNRVAIGDLNCDGINDIAVTNYNGKSVSIFYMTRNSVGLTKTIEVGNRPDGIAIHDLNSDGKNDIAVSNYGDSTITILFNK